MQNDIKIKDSMRSDIAHDEMIVSFNITGSATHLRQIVLRRPDKEGSARGNKLSFREELQILRDKSY